jgi:hypothetical protein
MKTPGYLIDMFVRWFVIGVGLGLGIVLVLGLGIVAYPAPLRGPQGTTGQTGHPGMNGTNGTNGLPGAPGKAGQDATWTPGPTDYAPTCWPAAHDPRPVNPSCGANHG